MRKHSQFLLSISHVEIQGRRANDIKHSASWEETQVFLKLFPFLSAICLSLVFNYIGLRVLYVIGVSFWLLLSGLANAGTERDPFMQSIPDSESHIYKKGGSLILDMGYLKCISNLLCNVATLGLNVATSIFPFSGTSRR